MHLHKLEKPPGSTKKPKRKGRGIGSTLGKTAGRGQKGQYARNTVAPGFEGGQTPLRRRLPRRGFKNPFKEHFAVVNVGDLSIRPSLQGLSEFDPKVLRDMRVVRRGRLRIKVLGDGEVTRAFTVKAHRFSKSAVDKIQAAGGQAIVIEG
jgi:large subunit ribosomal protein L15